ncbi:DUF3500 domain-containing protein [Haloferula chungangensis]|uniref:DUF3500 domain-containing protein n=1 Tax=Haloferula chungangensis TaxID=1048331 RepID=A0ABW2L397_9BACT
MKTLLISLAFALPLLADELPAPLALKTAASAFLASLDAAHLKQARIPFADAERENWHYTPIERLGVPLKDMNEAQKNAAVELVTTALSEKGAYKAAQIISLEAVLAGMENDPVGRDQEKYFTTIFGEPGDPKGWGYRIEGHHLSINITIVDNKDISVTPSFMGANPAEVREGESKGLRPLAAEEDLGRALVTSLLESGKKEVIFDEKPPREILTGEDRVAKQLTPVGITSADMSEAQSKALLELIAEYTGRFREDLADTDLKKVSMAGRDQLRFGWAGSTKPGEAYYYRIQGPTFLIEACNVQNNANHIHTVWRDLEGDFGRDVLKEHLKDHE